MRDIINKFASFVESKFGTNNALTKNYITVLRRTGDYGRSTRSEFWYFFLMNFIISMIFSIVASIIQALIAIPTAFVNNDGITAIFGIISMIIGLAIGIINFIYCIIIIWPSISAGIRRLHDANFSGWWYLASFCCCFIPMVMWCLPSKEPNNYQQSTNNGNYHPQNNMNYQQTQNNHTDDIYASYQNQQQNQMVQESNYGQTNDHNDDGFEL